MVKYNYIIYHDNCWDGFTGFYLFMKTKTWTKKPIVYPDGPQATGVPPDIDGKYVVVIDVAYKPEIIVEIAKRAKKLLFIDHHITLNKDIGQLNMKNLEIVYDEKHSGASLVWNYFHGSYDKMPRFVKYIEDNDIGSWVYDDTLPFLAGLEVEFLTDPAHQNLKKWDKLLDNDFLDELIGRGKNYDAYKNYQLHKSYKRFDAMQFPSQKIIDRFNRFDGFDQTYLGKYKVAVVNGACPSISLLGKKIVDEFDDIDFAFIWTYQINKQKYVVSLRSKKTDVGHIAKILGGGGHTYAAAFSFNKEDFLLDDLFINTNNKMH